MPRSVLSVRPTEVFYVINGGDGASTSDALVPLVSHAPTKFYVRFIITPVHEFHFLRTRRRRRILRGAAVERGVALERASAAVWCGVAVDALGGAAGLGAADVEGMARALAARLAGMGDGREKVVVGVEVEVVTPLVVALDAAVDAASVPAVAREVAARGGCGLCGEALTRDLVVRQAFCSHHFHWDCLGFLVTRASRSCPRCNFVFPL